MTELRSEVELKDVAVALRSRSIKGIYYESKKQRMCVLTSHGRIKIHASIHPDIVRTIVEHQYPGYAYDAARRQIGRELSQLTLTGFFSLIAAKHAFKGFLSKR